MLNYLWGFMIIIGVIYGAFTGNVQAVADGAIECAKDAITLCITMLGVMSLWTGLMDSRKIRTHNDLYEKNQTCNALDVSGCPM